MTSAAIYARVSSARQKKDQTIGSQTAALREHARQLRVELPEEWVFEDEGHSGATLVRPALEALRDLAAQGCVDVVLCYSPDRLARKFAYQALLIEEFARSGVRVEFVKGPRGDSPEDQLLVQFQGMFAEYEKAQLAERYRRGKAYRARAGSVNVLSGAPFGYRYLRKNEHAGAAYEIIEDEAVLVAEMFRRYADDGASIADLARWLTSQGVRTRTGKTRWDRSVIWGMLRNPAYAGTAVFGKTQVLPESPGLNRRARLEGRTTPRASRTVDRPREEWTEIPVPAIVTAGTFERAGQRLEDNKRYAARNTRVPSLLQGLAACSACGYGYYRTSTTTTSKKIYYYRCLGSDDYRYEGGRVCGNKPVRADYLDTVVWDHITGLLADPGLIRAEISKRLDAARTADPVTRQRQRLELEQAKATTAITAMIEAYSEQLITIDELRARMPHLRTRQANLRGQIDAIDTQAADRDAYLQLADNLEGFLAKLNSTAATASIPERQRVLRLLVKDVLVGPEKITIRHRIPARGSSPATGQHDTEADTEGDHRPGYLLRWGRDYPALGGAGMAVFLAVRGHDPGFEERFDQRQSTFVLDPCPDAAHQGDMPDLVKTCLDVRFQYPLVPGGGEVADLGDRVVLTPAGAEPVRERLEIRLEDGFEHQLQGRLDDPVLHGRYPELAEPAAFLRDHHLPHRHRPELTGLQQAPDLLQERPGPGPVLDAGHRDLAGTGGPFPVVPGHAEPRPGQELRVIYEVGQVTEPAGGIFSRPAARLGPHLPYLAHLRLPNRRGITPGAGIPRRVFGHYSSFLDWHTAALPHVTGFPGLGVLRRLRPARAFGWHRACPPPAPWQGDPGGTVTGSSRVHC
jgi:site-specific DNA recombinase